MNTKETTAIRKARIARKPDSSCHEEAPTTCCRLDCLEQPRFFCGQLLTDRDLMKLLGWSQNKFRLARFRQGWGVVCGLDIRCDTAPGCEARIIVSPGYAVDCCGDDIVVCEEVSVDLADVCREEKDPCLEFGSDKTETKEKPRATFAGRQLPDGHVLKAVDLFILYREEQTDKQATFGRDVCGTVARCEYGRTRETFTFVWQPAVGDGVYALEAAEKRWLEEYVGCMKIVESFRNAFGDNKSKKNITDRRRWLMQWIERHPLHEFCFVRDWICEKSDSLKGEDDLAKLLFWLVQDCRNAFLKRACHECDEDSMLQLARIYMQIGPGGLRCCKILGIDAFPPYRREFGLPRLPAQWGYVNLGEVIWQHLEKAEAMLVELNVNADFNKKIAKKWQNIKDLEDLDKYSDLVVERGTTVNVLTFDPGVPLGERVIGFQK